LRWRWNVGMRNWRSRIHMAACRMFLALGIPIPQALRTMYVVRMINATESRYAPRPYSGVLTLFRGKGLYEDDPNMGWDGLAARIENHEIGDGGLRSRRDIMNEPLVAVLARELDGCMRDANVLIERQTSDDVRVTSAVRASGLED